MNAWPTARLRKMEGYAALDLSERLLVILPSSLMLRCSRPSSGHSGRKDGRRLRHPFSLAAKTVQYKLLLGVCDGKSTRLER